LGPLSGVTGWPKRVPFRDALLARDGPLPLLSRTTLNGVGPWGGRLRPLCGRPRPATGLSRATPHWMAQKGPLSGRERAAALARSHPLRPLTRHPLRPLTRYVGSLREDGLYLSFGARSSAASAAGESIVIVPRKSHVVAVA